MLFHFSIFFRSSFGGNCTVLNFSFNRIVIFFVTCYFSYHRLCTYACLTLCAHHSYRYIVFLFGIFCDSISFGSLVKGKEVNIIPWDLMWMILLIWNSYKCRILSTISWHVLFLLNEINLSYKMHAPIIIRRISRKKIITKQLQITEETF